MKASFLRITAFGAFVAVSAVLFTGCLKDRQTKEVSFTANVPVYMSLEDMRDAVDVTAPIPVDNPGKIYLYEEYVFVVEKDKGIHVFRDIASSQPTPVSFINMPGCRDVAVRNDILFADSYVDLVTFNISDINNISVVDRDENVLRYRLPEPADMDHHVYRVDPQNGVVVGWEIKEVQTTCPNRDCIESPEDFFDARNNGFAEDEALAAGGAGAGKSDAGVSGSLSRFMIYDDYLYVIDRTNMKMFNIATTANPSYEKETSVGMNIETLFLDAENQNLYIGSRSGMFIYDVENPGSPERLSEVAHVTGCDPVFVKDDYAYVTIRAVESCGTWASANQLDVFDVSDPSNPTMVNSFNMDEPAGLAVDGNLLYLCDGFGGLKVFDASNPREVGNNMVATVDLNALDVIVQNGVMSAIGEGGLHQYDISDVNNIRFLNTIPY